MPPCQHTLVTELELRVKLLRPGARPPERAYNSAGYDIRCTDPIDLPPGFRIAVHTGIACEVPAGHVALVWDRGSTGAKGIRSLAGVIDADYRGEWIVWLLNTSGEVVHFKAGDKVAQVLIQKVSAPLVRVVEELSETKRGENRLGSSGT